jgi:hypothetical protein
MKSKQLLLVIVLLVCNFGLYAQQQEQNESVNKLPRLRIAAGGGWSYRTGRVSDQIPSDFRTYTKELKSGWHYQFDINYYLSERLGLGLKYSNYTAKNEISSIYIVQNDGTTTFGKMSDDIRIQFFGPMLSTRLLMPNNNSFLFNLSLGYMTYKDEAVMVTPFTITGETLGIGWDIGYDLMTTPNLAVGVQLSFIIGTLIEYEVSDGITTHTVKPEKESYENLSRIDLSLGIRFIR